MLARPCVKPSGTWPRLYQIWTSPCHPCRFNWPELASALGQLQDRLPPFSGKKAIQIIEETSQKSVSELFADFNETAVAAASIAQVHKARLPDGRIVAVKILRPGIAHQMRRDVRFSGDGPPQRRLPRDCAG